MVSADVPLESLKVEIRAMQHLNSELGRSGTAPTGGSGWTFYFPGKPTEWEFLLVTFAKLAARHSLAEFRPHTTELFHSVGHLMGQVATSSLPLLFQIPIQICRGILIKLRKLSKKVFHW